MDSIIIQIPREVLFSQVQFHKIFMLALLFCMGTTLFSCQSDGQKKKIDGVEMVDSIPRGTATAGAILPVKEKTQIDSANYECPASSGNTVSKPVYDTLGSAVILPHRVFPQKTGEVVTSGITEVKPDIKQKEKNSYSPNEVDKLPQYPGGIDKFYKYFISNLKVTDEEKKDHKFIVISFIIEKDGSLSTFKILRGKDEILNKSAIDVLKLSPNWIPGEINDEKVRVSYNLPIHIGS